MDDLLHVAGYDPLFLCAIERSCIPDNGHSPAAIQWAACS